MSLKLISGEFGGRRIETSQGSTTHPMSERVRGALFNIIGDKFAGTNVLDAFAGSGSLGYEALSRGAKRATFLDTSLPAREILSHNAKLLDVESRSVILRQSVKTFIERNPDAKFDIIFADPPYDNMQLSTVFLLGNLLNFNGLMVVSYLGSGEVPQVNKVVVVDNRSYGKASLAFYRKK